MASVGILHERENVMPSLVMAGVAHCSFTVPLPTTEVIIPAFTAIALMVTLLTFFVRGPVYSVLEVVGLLPLVV